VEIFGLLCSSQFSLSNGVSLLLVSIWWWSHQLDIHHLISDSTLGKKGNQSIVIILIIFINMNTKITYETSITEKSSASHASEHVPSSHEIERWHLDSARRNIVRRCGPQARTWSSGPTTALMPWALLRLPQMSAPPPRVRPRCRILQRCRPPAAARPHWWKTQH
jgi:hypothetical protein